MKNRSFSGLHATRLAGGALLGALLFAAAPSAAADTPEWLRAASRAQLPQYPAETDAVMLLHERITSINDKGEIKTVYRRAYKILRPKGRGLGRVSVSFDKDTRLTFLKAWCIPAQGKDYEVKEKDAVEVGGFDELYSDTRAKVLEIPAADPGNVIGYEYEQKDRPYLLQSSWWFQDVYPVRTARFVLQLPSGWEYKDQWVNHPAQKAQAAGPNTWLWEVSDLPAVELEPEMPALHGVIGRLTLFYYPSDPALRAKILDSWGGLGNFYNQLAEGRRQATPEIQRKVAELTSSRTSILEKIQALATFAQRDIRYVAIEIGIGGLQPHAAAEVFTNRYGDCKDKATLLSSMLKEIGVDSYYVIIHTERGVAAPNYPPSIGSFNHVILAIRVPAEAPTASLHAVFDHPKAGRLLFFDPTNRITPLGHLPSYLQANYGLLVTETGGELIEMPLQVPATNRLLRVGKLELTSAGTLSGEVQEIRWGDHATTRRGQLLGAQGADRKKVLEDFLGSFLDGFSLTAAQVENLEDFDKNLVLRYRFVADNYAKSAGNLLLLRPRVLGRKSSALLENKEKERKHPVQFDVASLETDIFEIKLPLGFKVEELPAPVQVDYGFAEYRSKVELEGNTLRYSREYKIKEVMVPMKRLEELKKLYRVIAGDERNTAVLQRAP